MIFHVGYTNVEDGISITDRSALIRDIAKTLGTSNFQVRMLKESPELAILEVNIPSEIITPSFRDYLKSLPNWKYVDFITKFEEWTLDEQSMGSERGPNTKESEIEANAKAARSINMSSPNPEGFDLRKTVLDESERDLQRRERMLKREKEKIERMRIREDVIRNERAKWEKEFLKDKDTGFNKRYESNGKFDFEEGKDIIDSGNDESDVSNDEILDESAFEGKTNIEGYSEFPGVDVSEMKMEDNISRGSEDESDFEEEDNMHENLSDYEFCEFVLKSGRRYGDLSDKDKIRFNKGLSEHKTFNGQNEDNGKEDQLEPNYRNPRHMEFRPKPVQESEMITMPDDFDEKRTLWTELTGPPEMGKARRNSIN